MNRPLKLASLPLGKFSELSTGLKNEILVIQIGDSVTPRFLTIKAALTEFAATPEEWLTYQPELAHHWNDETAARRCAADMATAYFRGHVVKLVRLTLVKGVYRAN